MFLGYWLYRGRREIFYRIGMFAEEDFYRMRTCPRNICIYFYNIFGVVSRASIKSSVLSSLYVAQP